MILVTMHKDAPLPDSATIDQYTGRMSALAGMPVQFTIKRRNNSHTVFLSVPEARQLAVRLLCELKGVA